MGLDRPLLARTPGLRFWRLLGTGRGRDDDAERRPAPLGAVRGLGGRRRARRLRARRDRHSAGASSAARRTRSASSRCARTAHGAAPTPCQGRAGSRRARSRSSPARRSGPRSSSRSTARSHRPPATWRGGEGLLASLGAGEWPVARQATFSLWRSLADAQAYAYKRADHRDVIRATRAGGWYAEELFARFRPYRSVWHVGRHGPARKWVRESNGTVRRHRPRWNEDPGGRGGRGARGARLLAAPDPDDGRAGGRHAGDDREHQRRARGRGRPAQRARRGRRRLAGRGRRRGRHGHERAQPARLGGDLSAGREARRRVRRADRALERRQRRDPGGVRPRRREAVRQHPRRVLGHGRRRRPDPRRQAVGGPRRRR